MSYGHFSAVAVAVSEIPDATCFMHLIHELIAEGSWQGADRNKDHGSVLS